MVSSELIRRYPFFAGLSYDKIVILAKVADEISVPPEHYFFHEGDELTHFYLVIEGQVAIVLDLPKSGVTHKLSEVLTHSFPTEDITVISLGPGQVFGWSALVPPHEATSSGKALTSCRVIAFDCLELRKHFEEDSLFGYQMVLKAAQIIRSRLRDMRIESVAQLTG